MFTSLARFDIRFRWLIVAIWIAGTVAAVRMLPALSSVTQSSNAQFPAASAPSVRAGALAAPFEGSNPSSTAVIVATTAPRQMTAADDAAFGRVLSAARRVPGVSLVRDEGLSRDGQAREALAATCAAAVGGTEAIQPRPAPGHQLHHRQAISCYERSLDLGGFDRAPLAAASGATGI